ncbi:HAD hydrolase-like protein [Vibrio sp. YMD68]|uniref:HAD family hydrolase n=1 Tax=Vibrio sp. YMD68 TaxID=3042300 RepID=UPI00249C0A85|nr:HAD hydrolase-like protein [Vibrio sp. YMD68]WGW00516.1 HAD hydrolase-like protein [Vibrio sp. YMD68]
MAKSILWDFDGVILDSMKIKGDGFLKLFQEYDSQYLTQIEKFHYENGGVSRFDKIRHFYDNIIRCPITEDKINELAADFAHIIEEKLFDKSNLINDSVDFIEKYHKKFDFHIVSGAEHNELNALCDHFSLAQFFKSISGSPTKKDILVCNVIKNNHYRVEDVTLVGDAMTDYNAAVINGIKFLGYNNPDLQDLAEYIHSFREVDFDC